MTNVVNIRKESFDIDISRRSLYGNPFVLGRNGSRADVIRKHMNWLDEWISNEKEIIIGKWSNKWVIEHLETLYGKILGCFCAPLPCHGNYLVILASRYYYKKKKK